MKWTYEESYSNLQLDINIFSSWKFELVGKENKTKNIDDTLDSLAQSKYFSTLELESGFWQVKMHNESQVIWSF